MTKQVYTIQSSYIGKYTIMIHGELWNIGDAIGRVQTIDIGKRAYRDPSGLVTVENQEQLETRLQACSDCGLPNRLTMRNRQIRDLRRSIRK